MSGARVVVVDDAQANLILLANILQEEGYEVRVANSAQRALTLIERQPPDLVLLDISLPDQDGYYVCRQLKQKEALRAIPVIFLSAHDDAAARRQAFEAGGAEYLVKPFDATEVLSRVDLHLRLSKTAVQVETQRVTLSRTRARAEATFAALCSTLPGVTLDQRYRLGILMGAGPQRAVFEAGRLESGETVTVRIAPPGSGVNGEPPPVNQAALQALLHPHPNIVPVIDCGVSETGIPYFVTTPIEGLTLRQRLDRGPVPGLDEVRALAPPLCAAMASAHAAGRVHGDIRPETVVIAHGGRGLAPAWLDFGVVALEDVASVHRGQAPERLVGRGPDSASDVFALGIMLGDLVDSSPGLPPSIAEVLARAVDPEPTYRPSAGEIQKAFDATRPDPDRLVIVSVS